MEPCRFVSATRVPSFRSPAKNPAPFKQRSNITKNCKQDSNEKTCENNGETSPDTVLLRTTLSTSAANDTDEKKFKETGFDFDSTSSNKFTSDSGDEEKLANTVFIGKSVNKNSVNSINQLSVGDLREKNCAKTEESVSSTSISNKIRIEEKSDKGVKDNSNTASVKRTTFGTVFKTLHDNSRNPGALDKPSSLNTLVCTNRVNNSIQSTVKSNNPFTVPRTSYNRLNLSAGSNTVNSANPSTNLSPDTGANQNTVSCTNLKSKNCTNPNATSGTNLNTVSSRYEPSTRHRQSTPGGAWFESVERSRHFHYAFEDTLSNLVHTIEQLKSKDKVISQLERELGHPAVVPMATEVTRPALSGQQASTRMETPTLSPHSLLSGLSQAYQRLHGTNNTSFSEGGEEKGVVEGFDSLGAEIQGLHDRAQALSLDRHSLLDKVKDLESKNKQLVEKNKRFLEKNIELTAQNRSLKDGNHTLAQTQKKLKDEAEEERRRMCELARELQRVKGHNMELESQSQHVEELQKQIVDQINSITMLRQACTDKDRRIELIQHRKKRRRLIRSQEKVPGVKETFYGYDDDDNDVSVDSETSLSSVSVSTISEEDACDELSREELERSHRQMLREHLQLERSHALLQAHTGSCQDPYRELQTRSQLQADLFSAQCRVELLEKEIRSLQSSARHRRGSGVDSTDDVIALLKEREELIGQRDSLQIKLEQTDEECTRLKQELRVAEERADDLEFRILELEEIHPNPEDDLDREVRDLEIGRLHDNVEQVSSMRCDAKVLDFSSLFDNIDAIMAAFTVLFVIWPAW